MTREGNAVATFHACAPNMPSIIEVISITCMDLKVIITCAITMETHE